MGISQNWSRENLAWAAGLFEGEGCIHVSAKGVVLYLSMTDEDVVRKFHGVIGFGYVNGPYKDNRGPKRGATYKPAWTWSITRAEKVQAALAAMWSFLGERRKARATEAIVAGAKKRPKGAIATFCRAGHKFTSDNVYFTVKGYRMCRECMRSNARRSQRILRARKRAENVNQHLRGTADCSS